MTNFFPRHTVAWKLEEPPAFRRLSLSIVEMAVITGVVLRVFRAVAVSHGPSESWLYLGAMVALGLLILCGMATLHLGNFPVRQWLWRAPAFALITAAAEALTSLALIALGRERIGTTRATFADWGQLAGGIVLGRLVAVASFALVLAGVVQLVRFLLLRREGREHTAKAVHDEIARQTAEHEKQV